MTSNIRKIHTADPSALGLFGLAMVTLVASSAKLGWTSGTAMIIPWAIFLGAFAQLFACINDAKKGNVFGTTAFGGYAFFWFAIGATWMMKLGFFGQEMANGDVNQLGFAYIGYFIFSFFMTIGATKTTKVLFVIFCLIDCLFLGLILSTFMESHFGHILAAWSELAIALVGFYGSAAIILKEQFGKEILPLGKSF